MLNYIVRRVLLMIPTLAVISVLVFVIIQLPPGDIITSRLSMLQQQGVDVSREAIEAMRARYHLDDPLHIQYLRWIGGFLVGDLGYSVEHGQSVNNLIWERLGYTLLLTSTATLFTWLVAFPVGVISALRQYTLFDYVSTLLALLGLATPSFLLALILMYLGYSWFGIPIGGLFSPQYAAAEWSLGKVGDLLKHLWIPAVVLGTDPRGNRCRRRRQPGLRLPVAADVDPLSPPPPSHGRRRRAPGPLLLRPVLRVPVAADPGPALP